MKINNIIVGVIGVMICAIMVGGSLLPVVSNVTATSDTYINEGYYTMDKLSSDDEITLYWIASVPNILKINGIDYDLSGLKEMSHGSSIFVNGNGVLRAFVGEDTFMFRSHQSDGYFSVNDSDTTNYIDLTLTTTRMTGTISSGGTVSEKTVTYQGDVYILNPNGNGAYTMKYGNESAYVKADSPICLAGLTYYTRDLGFILTGTVESLTPHMFYGPTGTAASDITIHSNESKNHVNLYTIDKVTFTITSTSEDNTPISTLATYSYFIVPTEVTADRTMPMDSTIANMVSILPIVAVAGLVMVGIYVFISRK